MKKILAMLLGLTLLLGAMPALAFEFSTSTQAPPADTNDTTLADTTQVGDNAVTPDISPDVTPEPTPEPPQARYGMTNTKGVNVRSKGSSSGDIVTKLAITGSVFIIEEEETNGKEVWYAVTIQGEGDEVTEGFIRSDLVAEITEAEFVAGGGKVATPAPVVTTTSAAGTVPGATTAGATGATSNSSNTPGTNAKNVIPGFGAGPDDEAK